MTSIMADNGSNPIAPVMDNLSMPQWKRDLIMRRRAQAQQQADASTSAIKQQLDGCACCSCRKSTGSGNNSGGGASVALDFRPPLGHQPTASFGIVTQATTISSAGCAPASARACCRCPQCCAASSSTSPTSTSQVATATSSAISSTSCRGHCTSSSQPSTTCCDHQYDCGDGEDMVHLHTDSDSSEELQYGPGIVSKLKNRYLTLTLRGQSTKRRPSILRKAASLEDLLDDDAYNPMQNETNDTNDKVNKSRLYETKTNGTNGNAKNVPSSNRYRGAIPRGSMKRARSVEAISRIYSSKADTPPQHTINEKPSNQKGPQDMLRDVGNTNGNTNTNRPKSLDENHLNGTFAINPIITPRINKPTRLKPVITEREKPPADVVKQTKKMFESRAETRTRPPPHTGEVAAKVATYKTIIIQTKQTNTITRKPPIKQKPSLPLDDTNNKTISSITRKKPTKLNLKSSQNQTSPLQSPNNPNILSPTLTNGRVQSPEFLINSNKGLNSPIPDVSMVHGIHNIHGLQQEEEVKTSLSETPDLILHSSPVHLSNKDVQANLPINNFDPRFDKNQEQDQEHNQHKEKADKPKEELKQVDIVIPATPSPKSPLSPQSPQLPSYSINPPLTPNTKNPKTEPLTLDITTYKSNVNNRDSERDPVLILSPREIEKNAINAACNGVVVPPTTVKSPVPSVINNSQPPVLPTTPPVVPRVVANVKDKEVVVEPPKAMARKSKQQSANQEQNTIVFNFADRKDVPDYIGNDGRVLSQNLPVQKAYEGGVTYLSGSTKQDVYDEDDLSLEGPPSPCDVQFINDNVIIDGKSSFSKKSKKSKLGIRFGSFPVIQVFEYPSEASMLIDDSTTPVLNQPLGGTTVPSLSGSTLANYMPKGAASEFQLGVTKAPPPPLPSDMMSKEDEDVIVPMMFSSGTNDILF